MAETDYYRILGVNRDASESELRRAYRKLALKLHPDRNPGNSQAEARFKQVNQAYETLADEEKRRLYDRYGSASTQSGFREGGFPGGGQGGFEDIFGAMGGAGGGQGGFGFSLDDLFGRSGGRSGGGGVQDFFRKRSGGQTAGRKAADANHEISIDFNQSILGCERELSISVGHHDRTIKVRIPKGIQDGEKLRLRGQGQPPNGDIVLQVRVRPHPYFRRVGVNLELDIPVTLGELFNGTQIRVPTPEGSVNVRVPPRSASLAKMRVQGKGVARGKQKTGDLILRLVLLSPAWPDEDSADAESAVEALEGWSSALERDEIRF